MTEAKPQTPATKTEIVKDANWKQINSVAPSALCKKCGSKKLTDLDGAVFCPNNAKDCPFV
jgi:hypothetical protein